MTALKRKRLGVRIGSGVDPLVVWLASTLEGDAITTEAFAGKVGMSGGAIRAWINGRRNPNLGDLRACVNALGYELTVKKINPTPKEQET